MARFVKEVGRNYNQFTPEDGPGSGSVTSVALTAPTGFTVSGSPITTSGTLALSFTTGYGIPPLMTGNAGRFLTTNGTTMSWVNIAGTDITGAAISTSNDTNILITASGNTTNALLRTLTLTTGWTGQLSVARGGTGASTLTGVLIGNGTSAVTAVVGTAGQYLRRNTTNTAYEFRTLQGGDIAGSELTKTDDTNVTLSLGGTPASALLQPVSLTLGWSGQLSVSRGGTGASTLTGVLIGNGTSAITGVTGTSGQLLRRNVANTAYEFFTASLISGNGVADRVAKWTSATNLIDSQIIDDGTNVSIGTATPQSKLTVYDAGNLFSGSFGGGSTTPNVVALGTTSSVPTINGYNYNFTTHQPLILQSTGQSVGIGVSPTYKLQIAPTTVYSALNTGDGFAIYNPSLSGANLILGVNGSGTSQGALIQGRSGTASTFAIQLQPYGGNVGIGINPSWKLDVNGVIGLSGTAFAEKSGNYNVIYDGSGASAISLGDSTVNLNAYVNNVHSFQNRGATVEFATISGDGLNVRVGRIQLASASYLTWGGAYGANIPTISGTSGTGAFLQFYPAGSSSGVKMALRATGQLALPSYTTSTSFTGTAVASLAVTSAGDVITIAPVQTTASGTYTPTYTGLANVDSTTAYTCQYSRVGDTVTVSGYVMINATADNTPTRLSITLPISSTTSSVNYANGTIAQVGGGAAGSIIGYGLNTAEIGFSVLANTGDVYYSFIFAYRII